MTFSRCCSYRKDNCYHDEYVAPGGGGGVT